MGLVYIDSFENYTGTDMKSRSWAITIGSSGTGGISTTQFRTGAQSYYAGGNGAVSWAQKGFPDARTWVIGCGFRCSMYPNAGYYAGIVGLMYNGSRQVEICTTPAGAITARRDGTILGTSANGIVAVNTWHHVEVKFVIGDADGSVEARLNGETVLTLANVDTRNLTASGVANTIYLGANNSYIYGTHWYDDLAVSQGDDSTFLGDMRVAYLAPSADSVAGFTRSAGATNFECLDEAIPSTTDYVSASVSGTKDLFVMSNLPAEAGTVLAVQPFLHAQKSDAGTKTLQALLKHGGTENAGSVFGLAGPDGWKAGTPIYLNNPVTSAPWSVSDVNNLLAGYVIP